MFNLPERSPVEQQIDDCGALIGISRQWYEEAVEAISRLKGLEHPCRILPAGFSCVRLTDETLRIYKPKMECASIANSEHLTAEAAEKALAEM